MAETTIEVNAQTIITLLTKQRNEALDQVVMAIAQIEALQNALAACRERLTAEDHP